MNLDGIIIDIVRKVHMEYGGEWDDLYQQAYLIAMQKIDGYDKEKGASLTTYLHHQVYGGLRDYVRRYIIKEGVGAGKRKHVELEDLKLHSEGGLEEGRLDAEDTIRYLLDTSDSTDISILHLLYQGYTQVEVSKELGISRQAVSKRVKKMKEKIV